MLYEKDKSWQSIGRKAPSPKSQDPNSKDKSILPLERPDRFILASSYKTKRLNKISKVGQGK